VRSNANGCLDFDMKRNALSISASYGKIYSTNDPFKSSLLCSPQNRFANFQLLSALIGSKVLFWNQVSLIKVENFRMSIAPNKLSMLLNDET
jgi:hypothetical protein